MSAELPTAVAEYEQDLGIRPGTFCAYDVAIDRVVDLRDPATLAHWSIATETPFCAWKSLWLLHRQRPPTWPVAERLQAAGAAGLFVPSARPTGGSNLVLWRWNDAAGTVRALDPMRDLPVDQASWPR